MARRVTVVPADVLRSMLAASMLGTPRSPHLGTITLRQHQVDAIARIEAAMNGYGGALLADAVGLGKTYVALAIARSYEKVVVIAPAVLRSQWERSGRASDTIFRFASMESLSRGPSDTAGDLVIVDEAHHFRNPDTHRYARLADLTATTPTLLLSATPIHNRRDDLVALLALFLGSRATELSAEQLGSCVIRREQRDVPDVSFPEVARAHRLIIPAARGILDRIYGLPPPVPPADGRPAAPLVRIGLAHAWASSDAALLHAITRRLTRGEALLESVRGGRIPTKSELGTWLAGDDTMQLGFVELLSTVQSATDSGCERSIREHLDALRDLAQTVRNCSSRDDERLDTLKRIRATHPGERIVVFTTFASTARRMYSALSGSGGIAVVTGRGACIASGPLPTQEVLRMFRSPAHRREAIQLLLATDLLSEGIDLPEASVIVHMDLPWTPARLEQRLGRLRRVRATSEPITSYLFAQPASIERRLRRERLLALKAVTAARIMGTESVPTWAQPSGRHVAGVVTPPATLQEELRRTLAAWSTCSDPCGALGQRCITAAACVAPVRGALALIQSDHCSFFLTIHTSSGTQLSASAAPQALLGAVRSASAVDSAFTSKDYLAVRRALERHLRSNRVRLLTAPRASLPRGIIDLVGQLAWVLARLPLHDRTRLASRVASLRTLLAGRLTAGLERRLCAAVGATGTPDQIIERFESILTVPIQQRCEGTERLRAVLLLVPGSAT